MNYRNSAKYRKSNWVFARFSNYILNCSFYVEAYSVIMMILNLKYSRAYLYFVDVMPTLKTCSEKTLAQLSELISRVCLICSTHGKDLLRSIPYAIVYQPVPCHEFFESSGQ